MAKKLIGFYKIDETDEEKSIQEVAKEIAKKMELEAEKESKFEDISVWIFQCNPEKYNLIGALHDEETGNKFEWRVNQYRQSIKKGHLALIWKAGEDAGIYAIGRIDCDPQLMKEDGSEDKYWLENNEKQEMIRVRITILNNMVNKPILKATLKQYPDLKDLSILKFQQGTNFPVRDSEWEIISKLID